MAAGGAIRLLALLDAAQLELASVEGQSQSAPDTSVTETGETEGTMGHVFLFYSN